jgi:hypothetical protein
VLNELYQSFSIRGMHDCLPELGRELLATETLPPELVAAIRRRLEQAAQEPPISAKPDEGEAHVLRLLEAGRPEEATRFVESLGEPVWSLWTWPCLDAVACCYLQLGYPDKARHVWERAKGAPTEGTRLVRIAATHWTERNLTEALRIYKNVQATEPGLPDVGWSLAWLHTEMGDAASAIDEIDRAWANVPVTTRKELDNLRTMLRRYDKRTAK